MLIASLLTLLHKLAACFVIRIVYATMIDARRICVKEQPLSDTLVDSYSGILDIRRPFICTGGVKHLDTLLIDNVDCHNISRLYHIVLTLVVSGSTRRPSGGTVEWNAGGLAKSLSGYLKVAVKGPAWQSWFRTMPDI